MEFISKTIMTEVDGKQYKVNTETGEATEMVTIIVPAGTKWQTPEQQARAKQQAEYHRQQLEKEYYKKLVGQELGHFYWILAENAFPDLQLQTIPKLVMLCSYLWYDNIFRKSPKTIIKKKDIQRILNISKAAAYDFWNEVKDKYITEENGVLYISKNVNIFRGRLPTTQCSEIIHYQKVYINTIRKLYRATSIRKHKQLGYVFKMLPYINLEYNILCKDAFDKDIDNIVPLSLKDWCKLIGYSPSQATRLLNELQGLTFQYRQRQEYLISYVDNGNNNPQSKMIFVNPHIFYNGSNYLRVEVLGAFCRADYDISSTLSRISPKQQIQLQNHQ